MSACGFSFNEGERSRIEQVPVNPPSEHLALVEPSLLKTQGASSLVNLFPSSLNSNHFLTNSTPRTSVDHARFHARRPSDLLNNLTDPDLTSGYQSETFRTPLSRDLDIILHQTTFNPRNLSNDIDFSTTFSRTPGLPDRATDSHTSALSLSFDKWDDVALGRGAGSPCPVLCQRNQEASVAL